MEKAANRKLQRQRELRGWSQEKLSQEVGTTAKIIGRWERGESKPTPYYRQKLIQIFSKDAEELGLIVKEVSDGMSEQDEDENTPDNQRDISIFSSNNLIAVDSPRIITNQTLSYSYIRIDEKAQNAAYFQQSTASDPMASEAAELLGFRQAEILTTICGWSGQACFCDQLQMLVDQEIKTMEEILSQYHTSGDMFSRRQALVTIAALPLAIIGNKASVLMGEMAAEEFLPKCAASITACWHILRGNGFATVDKILPQYVPLLMTLTLHPSKYQKVAACLGVQANILRAIMAMHRLDIPAREAFCHEAIRCGLISNDSKLLAASYMYLGYTYSHCYYPHQPQKAIPVFHQALQALKNEVSLLKSDMLMGLSEAYAQCKEEQEALRCMALAQEHFPMYPEHDPSYIYADCGLNTLYQWQGKMYLQLVEYFPGKDYQQKAANSLMTSVGVNSISERSTSETAVYQADASRVLGELEIYETALRQAAQMAIDIGSRRRYRDAFLVYQNTPEKWFKEPQIQSLAKDVFHQLPTRKVG